MKYIYTYIYTYIGINKTGCYFVYDMLQFNIFLYTSKMCTLNFLFSKKFTSAQQQNNIRYFSDILL